MAGYKKFGKDAFLMTIGSFGSKLLTFIFVPFYTAILTTDEYGIADLISTTTTLLFPFFSFIICEAMMRFALDKGNDSKEVYAIGIRITFAGILLFFCLSPIVFLTPLKDYYWFVVLYFITYSLQHAVSYFVRGIDKTKVFAIGGIVQTFVAVISAILFLIPLKLGIQGYLLSHMLGSVASIIYMFIASKIYRYGFSLQPTNKDLQKKMLAYSMPMIPNSASWWLADAASKFFLTAFIGTSATGIFSVANKIPHIMTTMTSIFSGAWKVNCVEDFGTEDSKRFFSDAFAKLSSIIILIVSCMLVFNKPIAHVMFSKDFFQAWQFVPLLLFSTAMHAYAEFYGSIYTASYNTKFLVVSTGIGAAVNVVLNYLLIPHLGIMGAGISVVCAQTSICLSRMIHSRKIMPISIKWKRDVFCYIVLGIQIFVATHSLVKEYLYTVPCCLVIVILLHEEMKQMCTMVLGTVVRKLKR